MLGAVCFPPTEVGRPRLLLAHTIKGKGVSFMEGQLAWHYKSQKSPHQLAAAIAEVEAGLMRTAFIQALLAEADGDSSLWLLNGDLGFLGARPFAQISTPLRQCRRGRAKYDRRRCRAGPIWEKRLRLFHRQFCRDIALSRADSQRRLLSSGQTSSEK